MVAQWVSMAECINEYRLEIGKRLPAHEWREWKNLFIKGAILPVVLPRPPTPAEPPSEKELRLAKVVLCYVLQLHLLTYHMKLIPCIIVTLQFFTVIYS